MRSATSFFNGTLLKKNWKRFWPIWALYFVILLFTMPVNLLLSYSSYSRSAVGMELSERMAREAAQYVTGGNTVGLELIVVFALLTAMAVWSYLYAARSAGGIHSLPVRREGLFLTNFVSGLSFLILPQVVIYVLMIICTAATGCLDLGALTMWLVRVCAYALIFFSGATFCALCTGHILALPAFYVIANVLVIALTYLVEGVLSAFVFGYRSVYSFEWAAIWLTPVYKLLNDCGANIRYEELADGSYGKVLGVVWSGNGVVAVYVVLAVVLAVLALVIYRRRHLERAGDVVAVGWMRPVFRYGVATCCGLTFGSFFYEMFYGVVERGAWGLLLFMVIFAVIGYFLASMLLAKSFRVFRRWKGCVGLVVVFIALTCVMEFDLFGFEKKVPDLDSVVSVEVNGPETYPWDQASYGSCTITDREAIELILTAHEDIVRRKGEVESLLSEGSYLGYYAAASSFRVTYELKSGTRMTRSYEIPLREEDLALEGTYAASLEEFVNLPEVI